MWWPAPATASSTGVPCAGGKVIPTDKTDLRCGNGQTGATIELALGDCTLTMQFTDGFHVSFGKKMAHSIRIKLVSPK